MKKQNSIAIICGMALMYLVSCEKEEPANNNNNNNSNLPKDTSIVITDFSASIAENPAAGLNIGQISASSEVGTLIYTLETQNPSGAIAINSSTGAITVANVTRFDYEIYKNVTAVVDVSNGFRTKSVNISITITDIAERSARVYIPDNNFENALISLGYDDVADDSVALDSIIKIQELNVSYKDISDLTGITAFTNLRLLNCSHNKITSLNLTSMANLADIICNNNELTSLSIPFTLKYTLDCRYNKLTTLSVSVNNSNQGSINCSNNLLTSFSCYGFPRVTCSNNSIQELNFQSTNNRFTYLNCNNNGLKKLLINNGNNAYMTTMEATGNPNLCCVPDSKLNAQQKNGVYAKWYIDATASYNANFCP